MKVVIPFMVFVDEAEPNVIVPVVVEYNEILSVANNPFIVLIKIELLNELTPVKVWDRFKYAILLRLYTMPFIVILVGVIIMVLLPSTIVIFFGMVNAPCDTG